MMGTNTMIVSQSHGRHYFIFNFFFFGMVSTSFFFLAFRRLSLITVSKVALYKT